MNYWLIKSEPEVFSIDDLKVQKRTHWDGVRNYAARNHLKSMALGDEVLFYHSNAEPPGVVGMAKVCKTAYPDPTAFDAKHHHYDPKSKPSSPAWFMVDMAFVKKFKRVIGLPQIKAEPSLKNMVLLRIGRLSVQPVSSAEFKVICQLAQQ